MRIAVTSGLKLRRCLMLSSTVACGKQDIAPGSISAMLRHFGEINRERQPVHSQRLEV